MKNVTLPLALSCAGLFTGAAVHGVPARNPIIHADVPDIAIIRVGDTYYMSSTTMHMSPGLPIMRSKDLIDWKLVGYAYDALADSEALRLENGENAYGAGSWASSLRYHEGVFYATTFSSTTGKTHVYTTRDIERGPWKAAAFEPMLHDHSLFFDDDGRVYMVYGGGDIRLVELTVDASGLRPGGLNRIIIPDASRVAGDDIGLRAEGSQLIKFEGRYYLFNITWPRGGMRTEIVHRADSITGPYEGRVVLQDRGVAQGSLIDTPDGKWYAYMFQDHGAVGRTPFLLPVRWADGWPVLGEDGRVPDTLDIPGGGDRLGGIAASDEFDGDSDLPLAWQWNHNPDGRFWSLADRPGHLRLTTGRIDRDLLEARNTLTQRTFGPECSVVTAVDTGNLRDGDVAGLCLLQRHYGFVGVKAEDGKRSVVMVRAASRTPEEMETIPMAQAVVHLRADCDFRDLADTARFYYSRDGKDWTAIGTPLRMKYTLPHFMGYRYGLFNLATRTAGGWADFDFFRVHAADAGAAPLCAPMKP